MNSMELLVSARRILSCGDLKKGEKLVIVTDTGRPYSIAGALMDAANEIGAEPVIVTIQPVAAAARLPEVAEAAAQCADLIVMPTSASLYHSESIRAVLSKQHPARVIALSEITEDAMINGGMTADFRALRPLVEKLGKIYHNGDSIRYRTPAGTDLRADISGRAGYWISGIADEPGMLLALPTTEVYIAPVEESVEGAIVVDASCSGGVGLVDENIVMEVKKGRITSVKGGRAAAKLMDMLDRLNDPKAWQIAEFGLGLNPQCRVVGTTEDEGRYGTCHIGIGSNAGFGGNNDVPIHLDVIMWSPTVEIDGKMIFKNGDSLVK